MRTMSLWPLRGKASDALSLIAGLIAPLGFAPLNLWPVLPLSCLLLLRSLDDAGSKAAAYRGWLYGVGFFGAGVSWVYVSIHQFGAAPPLLAGLLTLLFVFAMALFFACHLALYRFLFPLSTAPSSWPALLGFAALWVIAEWFRSWFLTGFPWNFLGYGMIDTWLAGWAPVTGVYGLSFAITLLGGALYRLSRVPTLQNIPVVLLVVSIPLLGGWGLTRTQWNEPQPIEPLTIALIQGNTPQGIKWNPGYRRQIVDSYIKSSLAQLDRQLIIWPETAIPQLLDQAQPTLQPLQVLLTEAGINLVTGIPTRQQHDDQVRYFNSVVGLAAASGIYDKRRLVPFGEYVPLESWLRGLIKFFDLPMSSFSLGKENQSPIQLSNQQTLAPFICYEIVYPDLVAQEARTADYLLTVSNDSWFGDSLAPHQHLQMARMRALENGRYLIRATNNGISAVIGPNGALLQQTRQFEEAVLRAEVWPMTSNTPFGNWGSRPMLIGASLLLAGLLAWRRTAPALMGRSGQGHT